MRSNGSLYTPPPAFAVYARRARDEMAAAAGWPDGDGRGERAGGNPALDRPASTGARRRKEDRSLMNITFRPGSQDCEKRFVKESTAAGLDGLRGHRAVGGNRGPRSTTRFPKRASKRSSASMRDFEQKERLTSSALILSVSACYFSVARGINLTARRSCKVGSDSWPLIYPVCSVLRPRRRRCP